MDRAADLLPDGAYRKIEPGHQHQGLEAGARLPRTVGVDGGHGAVVSGVHGLQHVQRFAATYLADDETIRAHPDRVPDQLAEGHHLLPRRYAFEATDMALWQSQFGGLLNRDDTFVTRDTGRQRVEQGRLPA